MSTQIQPAPVDDTKGVYETKDDPNHVEDNDNYVTKEDGGLVVAANAARSAYEHLTARQAMWKFRRMFLIGIAASIASTYYGYTVSAPGSIVANTDFIQQFGTVQPNGEKAINAHIISIWGVATPVMQVTCQFAAPFINDKLGRLAGLWALTVFMLIAIILEIVARDWQVYFVAKLFAGCATGFHAPILSVYMSEISLPQYRGALLSWYAISMAIGQFTAAIGNQVVNSTPGTYRRVFYSEFVLLGIWLPCLLICPESPVWHLNNGRIEKARKSYKWLMGSVEPGFDFDHEFEVLRTEVAVSNAVTASYSENDWKAFFKWGNFKRAIAAALPLFGQQICGGAYIYNYTTYFFSIAGVKNAFLGSTILNIIYLVSLCVSFWLIERVGRRPLLIWGFAAMSVLNLLIGGLGFLPKSNKNGGNALVALCSLWECAYSLTIAALGIVCLVEVSSYKLRAKTAAFGSIINSLTGLIWSYTIPLMISSTGGQGWGQKVGFMFGITSAMFIPPAYFLYPETKGRLYTEIDELYERGVPAWRFATTPTSIRPVPGGPTNNDGVRQAEERHTAHA